MKIKLKTFMIKSPLKSKKNTSSDRVQYLNSQKKQVQNLITIMTRI